MMSEDEGERDFQPQKTQKGLLGNGLAPNQNFRSGQRPVSAIAAKVR